MKTLAEAIDTNFGNEQKKAIDQLQNFYSTRLHLALRASQLRTSRLPLLTASGGCSPREACRVRILKDSRDSKVSNTPTCKQRAGVTLTATSRSSGPRKTVLLRSSVSSRRATIRMSNRRLLTSRGRLLMPRGRLLIRDPLPLLQSRHRSEYLPTREKTSPFLEAVRHGRERCARKSTEDPRMCSALPS